MNYTPNNIVALPRRLGILIPWLAVTKSGQRYLTCKSIATVGPAVSEGLQLAAELVEGSDRAISQ